MKKMIGFFIVILSLQGFSQEWAPLGAMWHYTQGTVNPELISYTTFESESDTTINGVQCKKIVEINRGFIPSGIEYVHFMYSDNNSVFFFKEGSFHLLYDFGAEEGDTLVLEYFWTVSGDPLLMIIDSTSTTDINGETRKLQYISCGDGIVVEFGTKVIEGIGNTDYMFPTYDGDYSGPLRCYEDGYVGLYLSPFHPNHWWNFEDCDQIITGIGEIEVVNGFTLYPNPADQSINIRSSLSGSHCSVFIYDLCGRKMNETTVKGEQIQMDVTDYPPGIYLAVIRNDKTVLGRKKFVVK